MLLRLKDCNDDQLLALSEITQQPFMKHIGAGTFWNLDKIKELQGYDDDGSLNNYQWVVLSMNLVVVGYLSLRPFAGKKGLQVRVLVYPSGHGFGRLAINCLLANYKGELWASVHPTNVASNKLFAKWQKTNVKLSSAGTLYNVYYKDTRVRVYSKLSLPTLLTCNFVPMGKAELIVLPLKEFLLIKKRLPFGTYVVLSANRKDDKYPAVMCQTIEEIIEYINAPLRYPKSFTYTMYGFSDMRKFKMHVMFRGATLTLGGTFVRQETGFKIPPAPCYLKNKVCNIDHITNKLLLQQVMPNYMPKSYEFDEVRNYFAKGHLTDEQSYFTHNGDHPLVDQLPKAFIVKPIGNGAHSGKGIVLATTFDQVLQAKKVNDGQGWDMVIQEYILYPLLFNGKKCHFRISFIVTTWGEFFIYPVYDIFTAKDKYELIDKEGLPTFGNKNIHDSHYASTGGYYNYQQHKHLLSDEIPIEEDVQKICDALKAEMQPQPYEEAKFAYEVLGVDLMYQNGKPILIEVNFKVGLSSEVAEADRFLSWEYSCFERQLLKSFQV